MLQAAYLENILMDFRRETSAHSIIALHSIHHVRLIGGKPGANADDTLKVKGRQNPTTDTIRNRMDSILQNGTCSSVG